MSGTKENILSTALRLFAQDGYEAVSMSNIAGELGMTKGAPYKHYKNKRDIFNKIFEHVCQLDSERSQKAGITNNDFFKKSSKLIVILSLQYSKEGIKTWKLF